MGFTPMQYRLARDFDGNVPISDANRAKFHRIAKAVLRKLAVDLGVKRPRIVSTPDDGTTWGKVVLWLSPTESRDQYAIQINRGWTGPTIQMWRMMKRVFKCPAGETLDWPHFVNMVKDAIR